jgi:hypothetical protein
MNTKKASQLVEGDVIVRTDNSQLTVVSVMRARAKGYLVLQLDRPWSPDGGNTTSFQKDTEFNVL